MTCTPECGQKLVYCFSRDCGRAARQAEAACANTLHQNEPCKRAGSRQRCLTQLCMSRFPPTELGGRALTSFQSLQACFQAHAHGRLFLWLTGVRALLLLLTSEVCCPTHNLISRDARHLGRAQPVVTRFGLTCRRMRLASFLFRSRSSESACTRRITHVVLHIVTMENCGTCRNLSVAASQRLANACAW